VTDGVNGFFSEPTEEAYAARIEEVIDDGEMYSRVAKAAREQLYINWDTVVETIYGKYQELIAAKREQTERNSLENRLRQAFLPDVENNNL